MDQAWASRINASNLDSDSSIAPYTYDHNSNDSLPKD
jgi:hypothetical protein